ncbi:MAG: hypothetical protein LM577_08180 [Thermoproteaceae archaeon]|nr:hypothetical protein [Thermoproteaceae archaeon]
MARCVLVTFCNKNDDVHGEDPVVRLASALQLTRVSGFDVNAAAGFEIPYLHTQLKHIKFDMLLFKLDLPIDINELINHIKPLAAVEDSFNERRIRKRHKELNSVDVPFPVIYIHKAYSDDPNTVVCLKKANEIYKLIVTREGA